MNRDRRAGPLPRRTLLGGGLAVATVGWPGRAFAQDEYGDATLRGAGSTFVQPLMAEWVRLYRADPHGVLRGRAFGDGLGDALSSDALDYEPVGSLAGIQRIRAGAVDFAASEMPLGEASLKAAKLAQFPWVLGGIAIATSVAGVPSGALRLDPAVLADIYLGRITHWSDPALARLNPQLSLPSAAITVLHRSDGSGTTYTLARYLAAHSDEWTRRLGIDLLLKWPVGHGHRGTGRLVEALRATPNAIGYVDAVQARTAGLAVATLRNRAGRDVPPDPQSVAAAASLAEAGTGAGASFVDAPGASSYPLVATVFGLTRASVNTPRSRRAIDFLGWTLGRGAVATARLGYVALPAPLARQVVESLSRLAG